MHHIALKPSAPPLIKPVRPLYAQYFREEIIPRGLVFDARDDVVFETLLEWQPAAEFEIEAIRRAFNYLDELTAAMPRDAGAYGERMQAWRRSDFWNMRWEDL